MTFTAIAQRVAVTAMLTLFSARKAFAQTVNFPTIDTGAGAATGDLVGILREVATDGLQVLLLVVGVAAFVVVGWSVISKFNECRAGRAEWSEAGVTAGIGAVVLVFATFLLNAANGFFSDPA